MLHNVLLSSGFGLITASILAIAAVGVTLQFGVTNFFNFAYGDMLTFGMYMALIINRHFGLSIWLGLPVAILMTSGLAWLINQIVFRTFTERGAPSVYMLVVTVGVSLMLQSALLAVFSEQFQQYSIPTGRPLTLGPFLFTPLQLGIVGLAVVAMLGIHCLLRYTPLGKAMRAVADSPDLARVSGINTRRIVDVVWLIVGGLAGMSGVVLALNVTTFTPSLGFGFVFVILAAVVLGGVGSPYGAMVGALIVGVATEVSAAFIPSEYKTAIAFVVLILALLLRPQGLLPARGRAQ